MLFRAWDATVTTNTATMQTTNYVYNKNQSNNCVIVMLVIMSTYHTENGDQVFGFSICRRCCRQFCSCWLHWFPAHDRHGLDVGCGMIGRKHRLPASIGERLAFVSLYDKTKVQWVSQNRKQQQQHSERVHSSRRGWNFVPHRKIFKLRHDTSGHTESPARERYFYVNQPATE